MSEYELYREKFEVTEWREGAVYRTKSLGYDWFDEDEVKNPPRGIIFAPPSAKHDGEHDGPVVTIRKKK